MGDSTSEKDPAGEKTTKARKKIENTSKSLSEKKSKIDSAVAAKKQQIDTGVQKITQPLASVQSQASVMGKPEEKGLQMLGSLKSVAQTTLNAALTKAHQPAELLNQKQQQAQATVQTASARVDAAKKVLETKETAHDFARNQSDQGMNQAMSFTNQAKQGIEDRQREFANVIQLVQSLRSKVESQVSSGSQQMNPSVGGPETIK